LDEASAFLREQYIAEFNWRFTVPAAQRGTTCISCRNRNPELIFAQRYERTVDRDNTGSFNNVAMQLERAEWRPTLAGSKVIVHQHSGQTLTLMIAGDRVGQTLRGKVQKLTSLLNLQVPQSARNSHFPTAPTTTRFY